LKPNRWVVLTVFALAAGTTQMLWLNFAPLLTLVQQRYHVSEFMAGNLVLVFPLVYVFLSVPAGALIDARGYRFAVGGGAVATAAFAGLRICDSSFAVLMVAQIGLAVAQPFVINGISKLVVDWFDASEGAIANGIGTMGMFLGMAAGMAATPAIESAVGLRYTMLVFFVLAALAALAFLAFARTNGPVDHRGSSGGGFRALLRQPQLLAFLAISFLGLGSFNGLTTWLEQILAPRGVSAETAGIVGGVLIVGGIAGAVVIPLLSDRARRRKPFLLVCVFVAAACTVPLCYASTMPMLVTYAAILGFFFLPAFALLLDMSAQVAGEENAGAATSLLMLAGNAGGVLVIIAVPLIKEHTGSHDAAIWMLAGLLVLGAGFVMFVRDTVRPAA
jgi:predicted MFS family arabinose efflux permease